MPTSNGLSYSMNSFPRNVCTIGALSRRASSISSVCAPAQPAPPKIVTRCAPFSTFASAAISSSDGHTVAVAIVQPVDQVQVAGAAAAGADGELAGEVRLCARGEGRGLLVPHVHPSKLVLSPDGVGDPVQRVSGDSIDPRDPSAGEGLYKQLRDRLLSHDVPS